MGREISREETQQELERAVKDFDWIGEFLGKKRAEFLDMYRVLHAQLREGDKLKIEVCKSSCRVGYGSEKCEPWFAILLYKSNGDKESPYRIHPDGTTFSTYPSGLLYSD